MYNYFAALGLECAYPRLVCWSSDVNSEGVVDHLIYGPFSAFLSIEADLSPAIFLAVRSGNILGFARPTTCLTNCMSSDDWIPRRSLGSNSAWLVTPSNSVASILWIVSHVIFFVTSPNRLTRSRCRYPAILGSLASPGLFSSYECCWLPVQPSVEGTIDFGFALETLREWKIGGSSLFIG